MVETPLDKRIFIGILTVAATLAMLLAAFAAGWLLKPEPMPRYKMFVSSAGDSSFMHVYRLNEVNGQVDVAQITPNALPVKWRVIPEEQNQETINYLNSYRKSLQPWKSDK